MVLLAPVRLGLRSIGDAYFERLEVGFTKGSEIASDSLLLHHDCIAQSLDSPCS
jgi:hypothetical protein